MDTSKMAGRLGRRGAVTGRWRSLWAAVAALGVLVAAATGCGDGAATAEAPDAGEPGAGDTDGASGADAQDAGADATCVAERLAMSSLRLAIDPGDGTRLLDEAGREVWLRGVNTGGRAKLPPFLPFAFAESGHPLQTDAPPFAEAVEAYAERVRAWGHTAARVPFTWEAVEPERGTYDAAFLDRYAALVDALGARGVRVIVDFHQDVFARPYCGDGFPLWATPKPWPPVDEWQPCVDWFLGYLGDARVDTAFQRVWDDEDGLRTAMVAMWGEMARRFAGRGNVVGYEVLNEPHHGTEDTATWAATTWPAVVEDVTDAVRAEDPGALVFFDATGTDATDQTTDVVPPARPGAVFAPHYYHPAVFIGLDASEPDTLAEVAEGLGRWAAQGAEWDLPVLVGEFGVRADNPGAAAFLDASFDALDAHGLHGTAWELSETVDDWNDENFGLLTPDGMEAPGAIAVIRAVPEAVAGRNVAFAWEADTGEGTLSYVATAGGVTEIVVPARRYPDGVVAELEGAEACWAHDAEAERLVVRAVAPGSLTVTFRPAASGEGGPGAP